MKSTVYPESVPGGDFLENSEQLDAIMEPIIEGAMVRIPKEFIDPRGKAHVFNSVVSAPQKHVSEAMSLISGMKLDVTGNFEELNNRFRTTQRLQDLIDGKNSLT